MAKPSSAPKTAPKGNPNYPSTTGSLQAKVVATHPNASNNQRQPLLPHFLSMNIHSRST